MLWPILFPFGVEQEFEPGTMPKWRETASTVWVVFVLLPIAGLTFFGVIGSMLGSGGSGGGSYNGGADPTCYPSSRC